MKSELKRRTVSVRIFELKNMKSPFSLLLLLVSTVSVFLNATEDVYDFAILQAMRANGLTGSAVAFTTG
jgi:hypothetical protein